MAIFRVEKNTNYTVMSNHHLRDKSLSLKAKGLLSQILSLPEEWDFTLQGLAYINQEQLDAIRQAVHELERAGYIVRAPNTGPRWGASGSGPIGWDRAWKEPPKYFSVLLIFCLYPYHTTPCAHVKGILKKI